MYRKNKRINKKKIKINKLNTKKCNINETKISAYTPVPLPFPAVSKANKRRGTWVPFHNITV